MAGGIDWFRWHHGSVTDPKFQLVAKKSGQALGNVIAVWAFVLEAASAAQERGGAGEIDAEALDCLLGASDGATAAILTAMRERGLLDECNHVVRWHERQPKREDETAAERKRRQREREHELKTAETLLASRNVTPSHAGVTQSHTDVTHGHDRGEESREEKKKPSDAKASLVASDASDAIPSIPPCPQQAIIAAYAEALPELPQPRLWDGTRAENLRARWRWVLADLKRKGKPCTADDGVEFFRRFFAYAARSDFLMGRSDRKWHGCDLPWLCKRENFAKVIEGKYHAEEAAA